MQGGFKDALCTYIGWDRLTEYDELILANDSFYGPFEDIRKIFAEMESRDLDFWGLMKRGPGSMVSPERIRSTSYLFFMCSSPACFIVQTFKAIGKRCLTIRIIWRWSSSMSGS